MDYQEQVNPWWAVLAEWVIVNAVNLLQTLGFLSRVFTGERLVNHYFGYGIIALSLPAIFTFIALIRRNEGWRIWIGLIVFLAFVVFMILVEYIWKIEFRSPMRYDILVPYLLLFFGSILLMGLPMFHIDRKRWLVTVVTTILLLSSMVYAMYMGVG